MEQQPTSNVIKGLMIAAILIILTLISYFRGGNNDWSQYIVYTVFIAGIILSCTIYGKQLNDNVTFGNTFAHGFKTTAVVAVIMVIFSVIFVSIFPDVKEKALNTVSAKMMEDPKVSKESIQTYMDQYRKSFNVIVMGTALFGYVAMGLLASLIGAAVTKRNPVTNI